MFQSRGVWNRAFLLVCPLSVLHHCSQPEAIETSEGHSQHSGISELLAERSEHDSTLAAKLLTYLRKLLMRGTEACAQKLWLYVVFNFRVSVYFPKFQDTSVSCERYSLDTDASRLQIKTQGVLLIKCLHSNGKWIKYTVSLECVLASSLHQLVKQISCIWWTFLPVVPNHQAGDWYEPYGSGLHWNN